jgi:hypothetical protein
MARRLVAGIKLVLWISLVGAHAPAARSEDGGDTNVALPIARLEEWLRHASFKVLEAKKTGSGTTGARKLKLELDRGQDGTAVFSAKWKKAKKGGEGVNNNPRKELAAYELQKLLLDPQDFAIPPTVGRCLPLELAHELEPGAEPTFAGTRCVFGVLSYWLQQVSADRVYDLARFRQDERYRWHIANFNIVTYLIDHHDSRKGNFLVSTDPDSPRIFSVDNGQAFSGFRNPLHVFYRNFGRLLVPALPRTTVERLRSIRRAELETLGIVAQYRIEDGQLVPAEHTASLAPNRGVRLSRDTVQFGLTDKEIRGIQTRLRKLLQRIDAGQIELF